MKEVVKSVLIFFCIIFWSFGCVSMRLPDVHITAINRSSDRLEDLTARFGGNVCKWGWVACNGNATYAFFPHALTPEAQVSWKVSQRTLMHVVDLRSVYDFKTAGFLNFVIYDDRVDVEFRREMN